jgi:hypothetical protein
MTFGDAPRGLVRARLAAIEAALQADEARAAT